MGNEAFKGGRYDKAPAFLQFTAIDRAGRRRSIGGTMIFFEETPTEAQRQPFNSPSVGQQAETRSCVHCQRNWIIQPGSGIHRGYCMSCDGLTCGKFLCETRCIPVEKWAEEEERIGRGLAALGVPFYL